MINGSDEYLSIAKIMYPVITQSSGLEEVSLVNYDSFYVGHMQSLNQKINDFQYTYLTI